MRCRDRSWTQNKFITKKHQVEAYVDLYGGPTYIVHFKYSSLLNVVFVTIFYGVGLPILFPICAATLMIYYVHERYDLAYRFKLPPSMDDTLSNNAIQILKFAPLLMLF